MIWNYRFHYSLKKNIFAPLAYIVAGNSIGKRDKYEQYLNNFELKNQNDILNYQKNELKKILIHCYNNIPYYTDLFKQIVFNPFDFENMNELSRIPVLTKKIVRENIDKLTIKNKKNLDLRATGGTSGSPMSFYRDKRDEYKCYASNSRFYKYGDYLRGLPTAYFWGNLEDYKHSKEFKRIVKNYIDNIKYFNCYQINDNKMIDFYHKIKHFKNYSINGFPSAIYFFVNFLKQNNLKLKTPVSIITTAECLYEYQRETIAEYFQKNPYSIYGCQEFGALGCECKEHNGFHLDQTHFIYEIGNNGLQKKGRLVITSLMNYGMPFIRYELNDIGTLSYSNCSCGRKSIKLINLEGRVNDYIVDSKDNLINFGLFSDILEFSNKIKQYQIVQNTKGNVIINLIANGDIGDEELEKLKSKLSLATKYLLNISFKIVSDIKLSPSGKFQPVKSEIAGDYI